MRIFAVALVTLVLPIDLAMGQANLVAGQQTYDQVCAGCHGFSAEGNALVNAPRLTGAGAWYLERQMRNFSTGVRGEQAGDPLAWRMARMTQAIGDDRELADVVRYITRLPIADFDDTVAGDVEAGEQQYALCAACHGPDGRGNEALGAPSLVSLNDWYLVEQLRLYAEGLRGTHPQDTYGQQMRAIAGTFADQQTRRNIAAYVNTLRSD